MARFAVYKKQTLSEEEVNQKKKNDNNDTNYYLRLEIEEDKILKSWKIPSRTGEQSQAIMYGQDLPFL